MSTKYRSVIFLDNQEDFDRWYVEFDESGYEAAFRYLLQWEYGEGCEESDSEPWGNDDSVSTHFDGENEYVIAYNWNLSYVSLTQVISDTTPAYREWISS